MGLIYIALSVGCSLTIAHFLKLSERADTRLVNVLTINYLIATVISFSISGNNLTRESLISPELLLFTTVLGAFFILNFFIYSFSIHNNGMGISIAAMRLSLVIPICLSLFFYGEYIQPIQYVGIMMVFPALYLMIAKIENAKVKSLKSTVFLLLLFVFNGMIDASLKVFERKFSAEIPEYLFLALIFSSSFIIGSIYLIAQKNFTFSKKEFFYGIIVGIANLYSSFFILLALKEMAGAIVFSITNVANVVLGALIGIIIWKDALTARQKAGLILALISILILI